MSVVLELNTLSLNVFDAPLHRRGHGTNYRSGGGSAHAPLRDSLKPTFARLLAIAGYWQSKISALLGDKERAMRALVDTFGQQGALHLAFRGLQRELLKGRVARE